MASRRRGGGSRQGKTAGGRSGATLERRPQWQLTSEPERAPAAAGSQSGGTPAEPRARLGLKYRAGAGASGRRRHELKRARSKAGRRANEMMERRIEKGLEGDAGPTVGRAGPILPGRPGGGGDYPLR